MRGSLGDGRSPSCSARRRFGFDPRQKNGWPDRQYRMIRVSRRQNSPGGGGWALQVADLQRSVTTAMKKISPFRLRAFVFPGPGLPRQGGFSRAQSAGKCVVATPSDVSQRRQINLLLTIRELDLSNEKLT